MRSHFAQRLRSSSLNAVPPPETSSDYSHPLAKLAARILYCSPIPSAEGLPIYVLNSAALPDTHEADFDDLLPYVLARLPGEEELISGTNYEVIFLAGGGAESSTSSRKNRPGWGWFIQAYHVLSRAMRKRIQRLYIVHERSWVRILVEMFSTIVSPKFRRKIIHVSTLSNLALHLPIENLLIPPSAYLHDRRLSPDIYSPYVTGRRAFSAKNPLPSDETGNRRLPRVLRETTEFLLIEPNLRTEGLFRIPPHAKLREILREAYDRGQKFIVWKDNGIMLPIPNYDHADFAEPTIKELDPRDTHGVHLAAGLVKFWYAELRQPIFPHDTYQDLRRDYGDPDFVPPVEKLAELISPKSEWSILPAISREIITRHLLPFLSIVAANQEYNKMTADNLSVCFAPALLCGPDQLEDAKVSSILRRILRTAIEIWSEELRRACEVEEEAFRADLLHPKRMELYEDPLEDRRILEEQGSPNDEKQETGIIMRDDEDSSEKPPPLPPRSPPVMSPAIASGSITEAVLRRKPAPSVNTQPPRYSTIITDSSSNVAASPTSYAAVTDGFAPRNDASSIPDQKKDSGTNDTGKAPPIIIPKRKALTKEQIEQIGNAGKMTSPETQQPPSYKISLPGLADAQSAFKRKPVTSSPASRSASGDVQVSPSTTESQAQSAVSQSFESRKPSFRKPSWPYSTTKDDEVARNSYPVTNSTQPNAGLPEGGRNRKPTITSLARPVYPGPSMATQPLPNPSSLMPATTPKPRTPSAGLLKRMPSFEPRSNVSSPIPRKNSMPAPPRKLNLQKGSVDDLRRLYEERVNTAQTLVMASRKGSMSSTQE